MLTWENAIQSGLVVTLDAQPLPAECRSRFRMIRGSHPLPTPRSVRAGRSVASFLEAINPTDTLAVLLSGGASAQAVLLRGEIGIAECAEISRALMRAGATIEELNVVRRHIDGLKGGGLAELFHGTIRTFILSDVVGDPLHVIGSGPTAPDPTTFADALDVLRRRRLLSAVPAVTHFLRRGVRGEEAETRKRPFGPRIQNTIIGNNEQLLRDLQKHLVQAGVKVAQVNPRTTGEAREVGRECAKVAKSLRSQSLRSRKPVAVLWGGEWTVTVGQHRGIGGPSQEAALAAAIELDGVSGVAVWTFSTDGRDGPTPFAGGLVDGETVAKIRRKGADAQALLRSHDSTKALKLAEALEQTGQTGTNLNHIALAVAVPTLDER